MVNLMYSIIIPFKCDSNDRLENLVELLSYLKKNWDFEQLIVSEMDASSKVMNLLPDWVDYLFLKWVKSSAHWCKSKAINAATHLVRNDVMITLDADLVVDKACIDLAVQKILSEEVDAVTPFSKAHHVPRSMLLGEMRIGEIKTVEFCSRVVSSRAFEASGGCFITRTSIFKHLRGMNELFIGWGLEDDELVNRYIKLGYNYARVKDIPSLHINHDRSSIEIDPSNFDDSIIEKNRGVLFNKEQVLNYFGITDNVGSYNKINKTLPPDNDSLRELFEREKQIHMNIKKEPYQI